jgi:hypothetical protein
MPQCPVCAAEISDDFGLIECSNCKTPLLVQMDGSVQSMAEDASASEVSVDTTRSSHSSEVTAPTDAAAMPVNDVMNMDLSDLLVDEAMSPDFGAEEAVDAIAGVDMSEAPLVGRDEEPEPPPPLPDEAQSALENEIPEVSDVDAFFDEPEPTPAAAAPITDLSHLANETEAQNGPLVYTVLVSGIDTAEIRKEFRDLIADRRFLLDVDAILRSINAGRVRMKNITAVKAVLLIHRLRSLPVHVQWEQHVVHQN